MIILTITGDPARSDGRIQPGDQLVEVDGRSLVGLPYLEGVAIIKATSNMATFRVRKRKEGRGDMPSREGDTQSPLGREKEQPQMVSVGTPLRREEPRDGTVKSADVGSPLASGENVATPTQQVTPSLEESTPTQQEATSTQQKATPTQQEATPTQQKATPTPQEATPTQQKATPTQQKATPTQQEAIPSPKDELTTPPQMISPTDDLHVEEKIGKCMWGCMLSNIPCTNLFHQMMALC